jgi:hypothetical protein
MKNIKYLKMKKRNQECINILPMKNHRSLASNKEEAGASQATEGKKGIIKCSAVKQWGGIVVVVRVVKDHFPHSPITELKYELTGDLES